MRKGMISLCLIFLSGLIYFQQPLSASPEQKSENEKVPGGQHLEFQRSLTASDYKVCFVGDTGTGKKGQYLVAKALLQEGCHQVRIPGDVIYEYGITYPGDSQVKDKFLNPYREIMNSPERPLFFLTMGNHDHVTSPWAWLSVAKKHTQLIYPGAFYSDRWDDICFFNFDSQNVINILNPLRHRQKKWFKKVRKNLRSQCRFTIAMAHHPLLSVGSHGNAKYFLKDFLEDEIAGKFDAYVAGHDHQISDEGLYSGTRLLVSGSGAKTRGVKKRKDLFSKGDLGYLVFTFHNDKESPTGVSAIYRFYSVKEQRALFTDRVEKELDEISPDFVPEQLSIESTLEFEGIIRGKGIR